MLKSHIQSVPEKTWPLRLKNLIKSHGGAKNMVIPWKYTFSYCFSGEKIKFWFSPFWGLFWRGSKKVPKKTCQKTREVSYLRQYCQFSCRTHHQLQNYPELHIFSGHIFYKLWFLPFCAVLGSFLAVFKNFGPFLHSVRFVSGQT